MKDHEMRYDAVMSGSLFIDFCGEEHVVEPGGRLTFGRSGDLAIDDNPYLHRLLGCFEERSGVWWLAHLGSRTPLTLRDVHGQSAANVAPGSSIAVSYGEFALNFAAGPTNYEVLGALEAQTWAIDLLGPEGLAGTRTLEWGRVELNEDQRLLLVAMCEPRLRDPAGTDLAPPANRAGAARLGWSLPKFNRKLDHLCEKVARAGVTGVHGDTGAFALDRRRRLVDHALHAGLVTADDLQLLDGDRAA
jgi:hypothetical protein